MSRMDLPPSAALPEVNALYRAGRYLDAYHRSESYWRRPPATLGDLGVDETLLAMQLAVRLGGLRLAAVARRHACRIAPDHPRVRLYSLRWGLDALRRFEHEPDLVGADDETRADWFMLHALHLAEVRDFDRAWDAARRSAALHDDWATPAAFATILLEEHRWSEAREHAEDAWQRGGPRPYSALPLLRAYAGLDRTDEAAQRVAQAVAAGAQSYELAFMGLRAELGQCLRAAPEARRDRAASILARAHDLPRLAPLAGPQLLRAFACLRAEAARLANDDAALLREADAVHGTFWAELAAARRAGTSAGKRVTLAHPQVPQRAVTCVPASVATCLGALGHPVDPDAIADAVTYGGTAIWRIAEWAHQHGLDARHFVVDWDSATRCIDAGLPFVIVLGGEDSGHACAITGYDACTRTLVGHDPASGMFEALCERLCELEAPSGPGGLVLGPPERLARLGAAALHLEQLAGVRAAFERAEQCAGLTAAAAVLDAVTDVDPHHPMLVLLRAELAVLRNALGEAIDMLGQLRRAYPGNRGLEGLAARAASRTGDPAIYEAVLHDLLEGQRSRASASSLPAVPSPGLRARWAGVLRRDGSRLREVEWIVRDVVRSRPQLTIGYAILGDVLWATGRRDEAVLPLRIAALLEPTDEAHAEAHACAIARRDGRAAAVAWLRSRLPEASQRAAGAGPIATLVEFHERHGDPMAALAELRAAVALRPDHGETAAFAAPWFARHGHDAEADAALSIAAERAETAAYLRAATRVARLQRRHDDARRFADAWVAELPRDRSARRAVLELVIGREGLAAAIARVREWMSQTPDVGFLELELLELLARASLDEERSAVLRARVARDPFDAWAWREIAYLQLDALRVGLAPVAERWAELSEVVERCLTIDPYDVNTLALAAEHAEYLGDREGARAYLSRAIAAEPGSWTVLHRSLDVCNGDLDDIERLLERAVCDSPSNDLEGITQLVRRMAEIGGVSRMREQLLRWEALRPGAVALLEARADLELFAGDRARLEYVEAELEAAIGRHPMHRGLRLSYVELLERTDRPAAAAVAMVALCRDFRDDAPLRSQGAAVLERCGRMEEALSLIDDAIAIAPSSTNHALAKARLLRAQGRPRAALEIVEDALRIDPNGEDAVELAAMLLAETGEPGAAMQRCEELRRARPMRLGSHLVACRVARHPRVAAPRAQLLDLLACAAELAPGSWEIVHMQALVLAAIGDFAAASRVVEDHVPVAADDVFPRGELAALAWRAGRCEEAIARMNAVLENRPDYRWGWGVLLHWLVGSREWRRARAVFGRLPDVLRTEPGFAMYWIEILEGEDAPRHQRDEALALLVRRSAGARDVAEFVFDRLVDVDATQAEALLLAGRDPHQLAISSLVRLVRLRFLQGRRDDALAAAQWVWRAGAGCDADTAGWVARTLAEHGELGVAVIHLVRDLDAGITVSAAFVEATMHGLAADHDPATLARLVREVADSPDAAMAPVLATGLEILVDLRETDVVDAMFAKMHARVRRDTRLWSVVGLAHLRADRAREAFEWLADWHERADATMTMHANFCVAAWKVGESDALVACALHALEYVEPDGARDVLLRALYGQLLRGGRLAEFVTAWRRHGRIQSAPERSSFDVAIDCFGALLDDAIAVDAIELLDRRVRGLDLAAEPWLRRRWRVALAARVPWFRRWGMRLKPAMPFVAA